MTDWEDVMANTKPINHQANQLAPCQNHGPFLSTINSQATSPQAKEKSHGTTPDEGLGAIGLIHG